MNRGANAELNINAAAWTSEEVIVVGCDGRGLVGMAAFFECVGAVWVSTVNESLGLPDLLLPSPLRLGFIG